MTNDAIADTFELIADLLEFQGANPFRVRAYRNGARGIRESGESIAAIVHSDGSRLVEIDGVGVDLAAKCVELVETGELEMLQELRQQIPESVLQLMRIPGLGPKKASALHKQLGIQDLDQLKTACESGRVRALKGFGAKTEAAILGGLGFAASATVRMRWADAQPLVINLLERLGSVPGVEAIEAAGSFRRGKETIGDIDILAVARDSAAIMDELAVTPDVESVLARGDTKMSVRSKDDVQVDLRVIPAESFGAALQYFTGSKEHNVILRGRAKSMRLKVNEYGVFREEAGKEVYVAGRTEQDVYGALGLPWIPPELREAREEFDWADHGTLPRLIEQNDLRGDLHMHTTASDGAATISEMALAARERNLSYIAITDHSKRVSMARGLDGTRLRLQWEELDRLKSQFAPELTILKGIECDILESGDMDLPNDVLAEADWVIASVHYGQRQSRQQITDRIVGALKNPFVHAIAHPTGRLINRREAYEVDMDAVMDAAVEFRKFLELNSNPYRLDLNDVHCAAARRRGIPVVINSDAHQTTGLDVLRFGILQARRGGLTASHVANTWTWTEIKKWLQAE